MRLDVRVTRADVSAECQRRILARYSLIDQVNAAYDGREAEMRKWIEAMRDQYREIATMDPIPHDFASDERWPK